MASLKEYIKTLIRLDVFALGILHISNQYISSVSGSKNMLKAEAGTYYRWQHGDVFYQKTGEGKPIVLLHDLNPAFSSFVWNEVTEELSKNYTVYSVDLPGCGRSVKERIEYTNYYYVIFLKDFIRDVVKKKTDILADGYSSSFALMASLAEDSIIRRIYAVNPLSIQELASVGGKKEKIAMKLVSSPIIGTTIYNIEESRSNIDLSLTEKYLYNPFRSRNRFVDTCYEGSHYNNCAGKYLLASQNGKYTTVDIRKALEKSVNSFTILYGSRIDNSEDVVKSYQRINNTVTATAIDNTRFLPQLERPEFFMEAFASVSV